MMAANGAHQRDENAPLRSESDDDDDSRAAGHARAQDANNNSGTDTDYAQTVGIACNRVYNWFPINFFSWVGGIVIVVCCFIDICVKALTLTDFFGFALLMIGALLLVLVEMPAVVVQKTRILRQAQLRIYEWVKLLQRMWGRAVFCALLMVLGLSVFIGCGLSSAPWIVHLIAWVSSLYFAALITLYLVFSFLAAKKYNGLYAYMTRSTDSDASALSMDVVVVDDEKSAAGDGETDVIKVALNQAFDELDEDNDGQIVTKDLAKLGKQAKLGLSRSECHAIFCYLDSECQGSLDKQRWTTMWSKNKRIFWC